MRDEALAATVAARRAETARRVPRAAAATRTVWEATRAYGMTRELSARALTCSRDPISLEPSFASSEKSETLVSRENVFGGLRFAFTSPPRPHSRGRRSGLALSAMGADAADLDRFDSDSEDAPVPAAAPPSASGKSPASW